MQLNQNSVTATTPNIKLQRLAVSLAGGIGDRANEFYRILKNIRREKREEPIGYFTQKPYNIVEATLDHYRGLGAGGGSL